MDTVPPFLKARKDNKFVYGRGASDTKAHITAAVIAGERAIKKGLKDFGLLFTVEEETGLIGAKKAIDLIPTTTKLIVVGEATAFQIVEAHNGLLYMKIKAKGKTAHGSTPELGDNAIEKLMKALQKIKSIKYTKGKVLKKNPINIASISGGIAGNVVPDYAQAEVVIRTAVKPENAIKKIVSALKPFTEVKVEIGQTYPPMISKSAKKYSKKFKLKTTTMTGFTEAHFFSKKTDTFILGLDDFDKCHSIKEKVSIKELKKITQIYQKLIEDFNTVA